jgi:hypothetical protein
MTALLTEHVGIALLVTAYVFTHVGMALGLWLNSRAIEEARRAEYARGRIAGLEAAQRFRYVVGQSTRAVERAAMAERN